MRTYKELHALPEGTEIKINNQDGTFRPGIVRKVWGRTSRSTYQATRIEYQKVIDSPGRNNGKVITRTTNIHFGLIETI